MANVMHHQFCSVVCVSQHSKEMLHDFESSDFLVWIPWSTSSHVNKQTQSIEYDVRYLLVLLGLK